MFFSARCIPPSARLSLSILPRRSSSAFEATAAGPLVPSLRLSSKVASASAIPQTLISRTPSRGSSATASAPRVHLQRASRQRTLGPLLYLPDLRGRALRASKLRRRRGPSALPRAAQLFSRELLLPQASEHAYGHDQPRQRRRQLVKDLIELGRWRVHDARSHELLALLHGGGLGILEAAEQRCV